MRPDDVWNEGALMYASNSAASLISVTAKHPTQWRLPSVTSYCTSLKSHRLCFVSVYVANLYSNWITGWRSVFHCPLWFKISVVGPKFRIIPWWNNMMVTVNNFCYLHCCDYWNFKVASWMQQSFPVFISHKGVPVSWSNRDKTIAGPENRVSCSSSSSYSGHGML